MSDDDLPNDPFDAVTTGATAMHEVFVSLMEGGFTEYQACVIIAIMAKTGD